ncbi:MAG TPA: DUF2461 domain-containing protein [Ignavibacteria bacterium]|nr:DUF2461 domain-containing protein [Ignavibacteria bacterium]
MLDELIKPPFQGFDPEAIKFLAKLKIKKNNNKEWFDKNRETYETYIKAPMKELMDILAVECSKIDSDIIVSHKSIFRINRDIRFSKDKSPYKTQSSAAFALGRIKATEYPLFYFHFNADEFIFASGQYSSDSDKLKKIRAYISKNFNEFLEIINERKFKKTYGKVQGKSISKLPKGYENETDKNLIPFLKMTQFYVWKEYKPDVIFKPDIVKLITSHIKLDLNFMKFLNEAVK